MDHRGCRDTRRRYLRLHVARQLPPGLPMTSDYTATDSSPCGNEAADASPRHDRGHVPPGRLVAGAIDGPIGGWVEDPVGGLGEVDSGPAVVTGAARFLHTAIVEGE